MILHLNFLERRLAEVHAGAKVRVEPARSARTAGASKRKAGLLQEGGNKERPAFP
jgi:hypothetical protein